MVRKNETEVRGSSRIAQKRERVGELIFEAAAREFAQRGFHATSMQDIAKAAGFSAPSLYTYFRGKKEIARSLAESMGQKFSTCFDEPVPRSLTFEQKLDVLLHRLVGFLESNREAAIFLFFAGPEEAGAGVRAFGVVYEQLQRWFRAHARRGDLGRHSRQVAAKYLTGIAFAGFYHWVEGEREDVSRVANEIREVFFRGMNGDRL